MIVQEKSLTPKNNILPQLPEVDDRFNLLILAFFYGCCFFLGTILTYIAGRITEHDEFSIFVQGWITVPLLTIFAVIWIYKIKQTRFQRDHGFFPILLGINALFALLAIIGICLVWHFNSSMSTFTQLIMGLFLVFPLVQVVTLWGLDKFRNTQALSNLVVLENAIYWLIPPGVGVMIMMFSGIFATYKGFILPLRLLLLAIPCGFLAYLHKYLMMPSTKKSLIALDALAILLIILACFDPYFTINIYHENFYMGPINALLHGKIMLVDVYSQYGVFLHEFLALFFKINFLPFNYQGLALLVALFCMFQYAQVYFLSRTLLKSAKFSLVLLVIVLLMNLFATLGYFQTYPSIGPVRFGLCYILITIIALRLKYPTGKSIFLWLEYGILGIASMWSFETFIYTGAIFYGIHGYESIATTNTFGSFFKRVVLELLKSILVISLFHSIQALTTFLETGTWPNWAYYFDLIYLYSVAGFGALPIDVWSPWFIIIAIYFICLIYPFITWIIAKEWDISLETQIVLCFTFFGIAQFTYYLGRSHPNNLFHICIPAIVIAGYGASQITLSDNSKYKGASYTSIFIVYATMAFLGITYAPSFIQKIPNTGFGFVYSILEKSLTHNGSVETIFLESYNQLWHPEPTSLETAEAIALIKKYAPNKTRVMIFLPNNPQATTEALFLTNKAHIYPITEQLQDGISSQISNFIVNYSPNLQIGDVIFLPTKPEMLLLPPYEYQIKVVWVLCKKFDLKEIENTKSGITAFRLDAQASGMSDYCAKAKAIKNK